MKKIIFCLFLLVAVSVSVKAQLTNSKWKGILKLDNPVNVTFHFGKDTLSVFNLDQNEVLETMTYSSDNSTITLRKISGQSDCSASTTGKYKYQVKDNTLLITVVDDACDDRAPYLNNLQLSKNGL
ncbi:MAG: hypothetical protein M3040_02025 [Bacteroidota bacterium]|nr:hypothetical protein [Bacteroidota bacterium]